MTGFSISRILLAGLVVLALFLAPLGFSGSVDAAEPHTHSSKGTDNDPGHDDHGNMGHSLVHCGSFACSPSYIGSDEIGCVVRGASILVSTIAVDDLLLHSLYLDSDPPVPRGGFFLT